MAASNIRENKSSPIYVHAGISSSDFLSLSFVSLLEDYPFSVRTLFSVYFKALCVMEA